MISLLRFLFSSLWRSVVLPRGLGPPVDNYVGRDGEAGAWTIKLS